MLHLIFIGIGGALGAVSRYLIDFFITNNYPGELPLGTLAVNLVGCLIIGIVFVIFYHDIIHTRFNPFIITGFLGALTTFSSYAYATLLLIEKGNFLLAGINLLANNLFGVLFAFLGAKFTTYIIKKHFLHLYKEGK
ncbi:MAG: fluoride efflux transporter CrcB [Psychrilyobacter sp.]|nr:fluoride efflux transporter CrcB [Psychrilyobacter sp.]